MKCPSIGDLPEPPIGKRGWPWTEETELTPLWPSNDEAWPKVSIVMPSFNQGDHIEQAIRSVILQGYPDLEFIVIDGGSTDISKDVINKYEKWIAYWVSEHDEGATNAVNKGFRKATGDLFGIMCADDIYMPGGIMALVRLWRENPESVIWAGSCPEVDEVGKIINSGVPFIKEKNKVGDWGVGAWFGSVACLFDGKMFRHLNVCDERFVTVNDVELWIRLTKGMNVSLTNTIISKARFNQASLSKRDWSEEVTALITANYIHGDRLTAQNILKRRINVKINEIINNLKSNQNELITTFGSKVVLRAVFKHYMKSLKRRIFRAST